MVTTNTNTATPNSNNSSSRGNNRSSGSNNGSIGSNSKEYSDYENSTRVAKFIQVCKNLPFVSIMQITAYQCSSSTSSTSAIVGNSTTSGSSNMVKTEIYNSDSTTTTTAQQHSTLPIKPSTTYTIDLNIATPTTTSRNTVTHSNYPHKPKPPAWYVVLGLVHTNNLNITTTTTTATATTSKQQQQPLQNIYNDLFQQRACTTLGELLAMKFIGSLPASGGGLSTVSVEFTAPERDDLMEMLTIPTTSSSTSGSVDNSLQLVVTLMCDSMAGLDYVVAVPVSIL